jgi:hypothetical protein
MYGDYEDYDEFLHDYNSQLDDLANQEEDVRNMYEAELQEIDEYWDREEKYIRNSGIYTEEEIRQILEEHNNARQRQKEEVKDRYLFERESIDFDREQLEYDRQQAVDEMEFAMLKRDLITMDQEQEMDARIRAARNEELAAYSDFIASLDMDY